MMIAVFNILYRMPANSLAAMRIQSWIDAFDLLLSRWRFIIALLFLYFFATLITAVTEVNRDIAEDTARVLGGIHYGFVMCCTAMLIFRAWDSPFFYTPRYWVRFDDGKALQRGKVAAKVIGIHHKVIERLPVLVFLFIAPQRRRTDYRIGVSRKRDYIKLQLSA